VNKLIDLRSDTVTRPTLAMREAMMAAPVGDDVYGDDPSVNELQEKIANMLGFEAALFMPSGTQSNLCAILAHCQRGEEYLVGQGAHTYRWEGGGAAVLGSVQPQPLEHAPDGSIPLTAIEAAIKPDDPHYAISRLLCLENTIGGKLLPMAYVEQATELANGHGLSTHLDGARIFNAAVAQAEFLLKAKGGTQSKPSTNPRVEMSDSDRSTAAVREAHRIAQCFDSVSVCFSKGLGAPIGSALCGSKELIRKAVRLRKMTGGGMRQAGFLAGAATYALDHHVARLCDDHALAQRLSAAFALVDGAVVDPVHTNIVFVTLEGRAKTKAGGLEKHLADHGILATGLYRLRFVTHLDVTGEDVDRASEVIVNYFA
jgi:threonine aldolase